MPFFDTLVTPQPKRTPSIHVYRKPLNTNYYLYRESPHHISAKYSVFKTLKYREQSVSSTPELLRTEKEHIREVLTKFKYPAWALDRVNTKFTKNNPNYKDNNNNNSSDKKSKRYIVTSYMQGLCESNKNISHKYCTHTYDNRKLKNILVTPRDKSQMQKVELFRGTSARS